MKKKKYIKKMFESSGNSSDVSANIYESMITSKAWKALKPTQKVLYLTMKLQYYSQKNKPIQENRASFYFNQSKWLNQYELYSIGNKNGFYRDLKELIKKGFINCLSSGHTTRERSVYEFSDRWQGYSPKKENQLSCKYMNLTLMREQQNNN